MNLRRTIRSRLRSLAQSRAVRREIDEELRLHLELRTAENLAAGMSPEEAARAARKRFGNLQSVREECREKRGANLGEATLQDIRFGLRMLIKRPGFTTAIVLTFGLGIGLNTAVFSAVNAVLLQPLPYPAPEQLVQVLKNAQPPWEINPEMTAMLGVRETLAWAEENRVFSQIGAYEWQGANLTGGNEAERVDCAKVSSSFLSVLGVPPMLGRGFLPEEDRPGGPAVAILSHGIWQRRFGSDTNVLGRTITLDAKPYTVVGVLAPTFHFTAQYDLLIPLALSQGKFAMPRVIGRLKSGVSLVQARVALDTIYQRARDPKEKGQVVLVGMHEHVVAGSRLSLLIYLGAVSFILLIACANVANLLLARAAQRRKEIAVRLAIGAGRLRIVRQLVTESALLAGLGAALGLLLAFWGKDLLHIFIPDLPTLPMDARVLAFTLLLALFTGLLFGLAPAWESSRISLNEALNEDGRVTGTTGRRQHRLVRLLVLAQVGLALVLLVGAGLLAQTFLRLRGVDPGFRPDHILSMTIVLSEPKYPEARSRAAYFQHVIERLRALSGVAAVGANAMLPLTQFRMTYSGLEIEGQTAPAPGEYRFLRCGIVNGDYFRAMGIPLKKGRSFTDDDQAGEPEVALVNESFARRYFPHADPIGKRLGSGKDAMTIVGVVGDERLAVESPAEVQIYRCYLQAGAGVMSLAVRTHGDPAKLAGAVRSAVLSVDRDQPLYSLMTLDQRLADSLRPQRLNMLLVGTLGALALGLSVVGIYGVLSFSVARRTHEIGVRMALGAERGDILRLVIGEGLKLTLAGVCIGVFAALGLTRLLASLLWGVSAFDPATFAGVSALLIAVALIACWLPACRAAKVDPMTVLRYE